MSSIHHYRYITTTSIPQAYVSIRKFLYNNNVLIGRLSPILRNPYCFFRANQITNLWTIISVELSTDCTAFI